MLTEDRIDEYMPRVVGGPTSALLREAAEELRRLREGLRKYGEHLPGCMAPYNMTVDESRCTCGRNALLSGSGEGG